MSSWMVHRVRCAVVILLNTHQRLFFPLFETAKRVSSESVCRGRRGNEGRMAIRSEDILCRAKLYRERPRPRPPAIRLNRPTTFSIGLRRRGGGLAGAARFLARTLRRTTTPRPFCFTPRPPTGSGFAPPCASERSPSPDAAAASPAANPSSSASVRGRRRWRSARSRGHGAGPRGVARRTHPASCRGRPVRAWRSTGRPRRDSSRPATDRSARGRRNHRPRDERSAPAVRWSAGAVAGHVPRPGSRLSPSARKWSSSCKSALRRPSAPIRTTRSGSSSSWMTRAAAPSMSESGTMKPSDRPPLICSRGPYGTS